MEMNHRILMKASGFMNYVGSVHTLGDAAESLVLKYQCKGDEREYLRRHSGQSKQALKCAVNELSARSALERAGHNETLSRVADLERGFETALPLMESPLEKTILPALLVADWPSCDAMPAKVALCDYRDVIDTIDEDRALVVPQLKVANYRLDFGLFIRTARGVQAFAIECDGKDYHDTESDNIRDRNLLQNEGFATLRFAGSDIMRNPFECAMYAVDLVKKFQERGEQ